VLQGAGAIYPFPEFWLSDNFLSKNFCLCVQNLNWKSPILGKFKDKIHFSSIHNFLCRKFVLSVSTSCLSPTFFYHTTPLLPTSSFSSCSRALSGNDATAEPNTVLWCGSVLGLAYCGLDSKSGVDTAGGHPSESVCVCGIILQLTIKHQQSEWGCKQLVVCELQRTAAYAIKLNDIRWYRRSIEDPQYTGRRRRATL